LNLAKFTLFRAGRQTCRDARPEKGLELPDSSSDSPGGCPPGGAPRGARTCQIQAL